jgi:tetratricopeptide (TPR) repeat protein
VMRLIVILAALLCSGASLAAEPLPFLNYSGCAQLAKINPAKALKEAEAWRDEGGGAAATHCSALALTQLKRYGEAAARLDGLAKTAGVGDFRDRAALYDQAGNAWLLAQRPKEAARSFSEALALTPNDVEIHADRARAKALTQDWAGAEADLSAALLMDQDRADLLSLRASARRALNRKIDAATDILRALTLFPNYPAALVERGGMKYEAGDVNGARKDWQVAAKGRGDSAAAAKRLLAAMGPEKKPISAK